MEILDLYDEDRNKTGKTIVRGNKCPGKLCRMTLHICIFNKRGQMLIQKRSDNRPTLAGKWDISLGGNVQSGETTKIAAVRELKEELGLSHDFTNERAHFTINFENGFDDIYLIEKDIKLKDVKFVDHEVSQVKWATKQQIHDMIKTGEFIPYIPSVIDVMFDMRKCYGMF